MPKIGDGGAIGQGQGIQTVTVELDKFSDHAVLAQHLGFPIDDVTLSYMRLSGRSEEQVALVEAYAKAQGMSAKAFGTSPSATRSCGRFGPARLASTLPISSARVVSSRSMT
jgi:hypothetical protein